MNINKELLIFKRKYPLTIAFRLFKHSEIIKKHLKPDENVLFVFCGQKNVSSFHIINTCVMALTNKRIMIGQKRVLWGYFFTSITPDMYNDIKVKKNLIWSDLEIDTIKENIYLSNLDPDAAIEIESIITDYMIKEKKKYD